MKKFFTIAAISVLGMTVQGTLAASRAAAQDPILVPIIVNEIEPIVANEVAPIVVKVLTPKPKVPAGLEKFEGYIVHANIAQVTVRAKGNDMGIQTFALNQTVSAQMQRIVDQGGYQYGDKITVYYDPSSHTAVKIKGKPSRPL
ncbi:MAG: hypothetical protein ACLPZF_27775 [Candidatus Acidiferrales bacterium]